MRRVRTVLLIVLAGVVTACNGAAETPPADRSAAEGPAAGTPAPDASPSAQDEAPSTAPSEEAVIGEGVGVPVLTNSEGLTLYYFRKDEPGSSNCNEPCSDTWPPVPADEPINSSALEPSLLGSITRDDGTEQLAYDDLALYLFEDDLAPGDVEGQGLSNVWFAVAVDGSEIGPKGGVRIGSTDAGDALIDPGGFTLYVFDDDEKGRSNCNDRCAETWVPVPGDTAIDNSIDAGQFDTIRRGDGDTQLTLDGRPLYHYADDDNPGDAKGEGVGDVWFAVPADEVEAGSGGGEITVGHTELGPTLVDDDGKTLYAFTNDAFVNEAQGQSNCNGSCAEAWPPVPGDIAVDTSAVTGQTRTVIREDGSSQLAIGDWPLYTSLRDAEAGDINGQGSSGAWYAVAPDGTIYEE
jgi:predicted lipoprotein with Yx(FWY)xxD motif